MTTHLVGTALGPVRGAAGGGLLRFRGIPYARPPVGPLRFAPPEPAGPWAGTLDATGPAVVAPQRPSRLVSVVGGFEAPQREDCLQVSVTTPGADDRRRPVLVWLHGGGFTSGGGTLPWYDGGTLARGGDVVVVGVNYRLGPLGFLRVDGAGEGDAGLLDMVAALRWVRDNVAAFGGDPGNVTVFGQSAGALATLVMLARPDARALFHRAILQSPPGGAPPHDAERADRAATLLHRALGYGTVPAAELRRRLRAEPTGRLLTAAARVARDTAVPGGIAPPLMPVADGLHTTELLVAGAARGALAAGIPVLAGTTRDEARAMVPADLADAVTEAAFAEPCRAFAAAVAGGGGAAVGGGAVWTYRLDWAPAGSPFGACHCLELPLVFGTAGAWAGAPMLAGADPAEQDALSRLVRAAWLGFARDGRPGGPLPWPRDGAHPATTIDARPSIQDTPQRTRS